MLFESQTQGARLQIPKEHTPVFVCARQNAVTRSEAQRHRLSRGCYRRQSLAVRQVPGCNSAIFIADRHESPVSRKSYASNICDAAIDAPRYLASNSIE